MSRRTWPGTLAALIGLLLPLCLVRADEIVIGGRVVLPGGEPLPEVELALLPLEDGLTAARAELDGEPAKAAARALTDQEGRFRFAAPHAGLWSVRIEAPGFAPLETSLQPLLEPVELPDAELVTDAGITVTITDDEGNPLPAARVRVDTERPRYSSGPTWSIPTRRGETGEDGRLRLPRGEGERVSLSAAAEGRVYQSRDGLFGTAASLRLVPGTPRTVEVRSETGKPLAAVVAFVGRRPVAIDRTDARGRLVVSLDAASGVKLHLSADGGGRLATLLTAEVEQEQEGVPRQLTLQEPAGVSGRLIDARTRRPVAGGLVWDGTNPLSAALTGSSGGFELRAYERRVELMAGAPSYMISRGPALDPADTTRRDPTLALEPAAAIEGRVLDGDENAVAGVEVTADVRRQPGEMRIEIGRQRRVPRAITNSRGHFRLSPLDPQNRYTVKARAEGFAPAEVAVSDLQPYRTRTDVRLTLWSGQTVIGLVADAEGNALRETAVTLEPAAPGGMGMMRVMRGGDGAPAFNAVSDDDGRFELRGISAGTYDVEARRAGFATHKLRAVEIEEQDEPLDLGTLTLEPGEAVQGIVLDDDGQPVEGVAVRRQESGGMAFMMAGPGHEQPEPPDAVTDPTGWFRIDDLAAEGRYSLAFQRRGFVDESVRQVELPQSEPLEVVMTPASDVAGTVVDPEGEPIAGAQVNLARSRTMEMGGAVMQMMMMTSDSTDGEGRFEFEDQEPGRISLSAVAPGWQQVKRDDIEVPKGEDLENLELPLPVGAIVQGRVTGPDGTPAIGASVSQVGEAVPMHDPMQGVRADGDGYYRLDGLAPGPTSLQARHPDWPRGVKDVEIEEGLNNVDLELEGGHEVSGRVSDLSGILVAGATVRLIPAGRSWGGPAARSGFDGSFLIPGVQDGDYGIRVQAESYAPSSGDERVNVRGEPVRDLALRLSAGATLGGTVSGLEPEELVKVGVRAAGPTFTGFDGARVDRDGEYRIEHLPPGDYSVVAEMEGSGRRASGHVTIDEGAEEASLDLAFTPGLTLSGQVLQDGRAIGNVNLYAEGIDVEHFAGNQADHQGRFRIEGLIPGRYRLRLQDWRSGLSHNETVDMATSREITIEVPTAILAGRIVDSADRSPLSGVAVKLTPEDVGEGFGALSGHSATTDLDGRFTLTSVSDGDWKLVASKRGYAAVSMPMTVQFERDDDDLFISMDATSGLTLEARLPSGAAPSELRVAVMDRSGGALLSGNYATGENGRVRLSSVPPGSWNLIVSAAGSAVTNLTADAPGATIPVALQPACRLRVQVPELAEANTTATVSLPASTACPTAT